MSREEADFCEEASDLSEEPELAFWDEEPLDAADEEEGLLDAGFSDTAEELEEDEAPLEEEAGAEEPELTEPEETSSGSSKG